MEAAVLVALVFGVVIAGGVLVVISGVRHRTRVLEMAHRERLAMIEKGLTPPPELDAALAGGPDRQRAAREGRLMTVGILVVGLGVALALMLAFAAGEEEVAAGVGGGVAVIGLALIVTARLVYGRPE